MGFIVCVIFTYGLRYCVLLENHKLLFKETQKMRCNVLPHVVGAITNMLFIFIIAPQKQKADSFLGALQEFSIISGM